MKTRIFEFVFVLLTMLVTVFNSIGLIVDSFFYKIDDLPKGEFLYSVMSPDSLKTLKIYRVNIERVGTAVRGEIVNTSNNSSAKNIYWETGVSTAIATWTDEDSVNINAHDVSINGQPFDSRRQIVLPEASAKNRMQ